MCSDRMPVSGRIMLLLELLQTNADLAIGGLVTLGRRAYGLHLPPHRQALISNQVNLLTGLAIL